MRIVTLDTIAYGRAVHRTLNALSIFVGVAGQAQAGTRGRDELDPRDVFVHADLMTTGAAHCDGRVNGLALTFFRVTFQALGGIGDLVERDGVRSGENRNGTHKNHEQQLEKPRRVRVAILTLPHHFPDASADNDARG